MDDNTLTLLDEIMDDNTLNHPDEKSVNVNLTLASSVNPIISMGQKIVQFTNNLNSWSSRMVVLHRDQYVDISSAAQGPSSILPIGIYPPQEITANLAYHASYQFDSDRFKGIQSKGELFEMMTSPTCVDGCKLILKNVDYRTSIYHKCTWSFACSHARVYSQSQQSFDQGLVSKTNVSNQSLKRTKSKGTRVKGMSRLSRLIPFCNMKPYIYINSYISIFSFIVLGTDTMSSKPTHHKIKNDNQIQRPVVKLDIARKTSTSHASSNDTRCPMVLVIYLGTDDLYYLSKKSNLTHAFHPKFES